MSTAFSNEEWNSSPSISMFSGTRERVSPQAVQDLMELCRLGGGRRAISPESVRSSRSPSPPTSSGRTSPAMSALSSLSRLKVATASLSGGMRKLSSSPHLLGICEEGEDVETSPVILPSSRQGSTRSNRSSSTGLVHLRHTTVQAKSICPHTQPTYSSVRMIRPRHAVVSPDVCRRYDQHQRLISRNRRSTSCSSSEASDDEEGKRLSILGSLYCDRKRDGDNDKDDSTGGQGGVAGGTRATEEETKPHSTHGGANTHSGTDTSRERRVGGAAEGCVPTGQQTLRPIPEMTHLDSEKGDCLRARLFHRSHTAERIGQDWALVHTKNYAREVSCFGTPPRDAAHFACDVKQAGVSCWIRSLKRTRSDDGMHLGHHVEEDSIVDSVFDALLESVPSTVNDGLERESDSGCSSEKASRNKVKEDTYSSRDVTSLKAFDPLLLYDQPRREKVDVWLRSTHFI